MEEVYEKWHLKKMAKIYEKMLQKWQKYMLGNPKKWQQKLAKIYEKWLYKMAKIYKRWPLKMAKKMATIYIFFEKNGKRGKK